MTENQQYKIRRGKSVVRSSNIELYRIICMFLILSHHFAQHFYLGNLPFCDKTVFLNVLGMWGKTGINCFMMITGYYMCKSNITMKKFLKLLLEVYFYKIIIFVIMYVIGYENLSAIRVLQIISPIWNIEQNFMSCFICFFLTIPFWNILIKNMTEMQHLLLTLLLLFFYTICASTIMFHVTFNYITWFGVIYLIASYIRLYPKRFFDSKRFWLYASISSIGLAIASIFVCKLVFGSLNWIFVHDANKILAVTTAVCSFMYFRNLNIKYNKYINIIGGSTLAVLLIHSNSEAMRKWLFFDTINCNGLYMHPFFEMVAYCFCVLILVFITCIIIDRLRIMLFEEPFFRWYDQKPRFQKLTLFLTK